MAADAEHGPDSDNYFKANDPAESYDVETRVKTLNFLSRTRSPSAQKEQDRQESKEKAKKEKSEKSKPEPKAEEEAHVLGAWLLDEKVLELLKIHSQKKGNTGHTTKSQPEVSTKAAGKGTSKTTPAGSDTTQRTTTTPTAPANTQDQMTSSVKTGKTLISL